MAVTMVGCGLKSPDSADNNAGANNDANADVSDAEDNNDAADDAADDDASSGGASEPEVTLVYAEVNPLDTIVGQTATKFKEEVERLSDGTIEIDVQASGVLGSENDVLYRKSTRLNSSHIH